MKIDKTKVAAKVKDLVVNHLYIMEGDYNPASDFFDDFGADSLDAIEMLIEAEKVFDIQIPDEEAEGIRNGAQAIELIVAKIESKN